jgi:hypothetical protein
MICEIFFEHVHNLLLCDALEIAAPKAQRKHHIKIGQGRHSTPHFTWKGTGKGITIDRDVSCWYIASHCATAQKLRVRLRRALRLRKSVLSRSMRRRISSAHANSAAPRRALSLRRRASGERDLNRLRSSAFEKLATVA